MKTENCRNVMDKDLRPTLNTQEKYVQLKLFN